MKIKFLLPLLISVLFTDISFAGREVGDGEPVPFRMPTQDFGYECDLDFAGRLDSDSLWYQAQTTLKFSKKDLLDSFEPGALFSIVTTLPENHIWEIWSNYPYKEYEELPEIFRGHKIALKMSMKANVVTEPEQPEDPEEVVVQALFSSDRITGDRFTSASTYIDFSSYSTFGTTLIAEKSDIGSILRMRSKCKRMDE